MKATRVEHTSGTCSYFADVIPACANNFTEPNNPRASLSSHQKEILIKNMTICQWSEITKSVPATYSYIQLELLSFFGISCFVFDFSCFYFATNFPHFRRYRETYGKFCIHSVRSLRVCSSVQDRTRLLRKLLARWMGLRYSASVRQFKHRMKLWAFVRKNPMKCNISNEFS